MEVQHTRNVMRLMCTDFLDHGEYLLLRDWGGSGAVEQPHVLACIIVITADDRGLMAKSRTRCK